MLKLFLTTQRRAVQQQALGAPATASFLSCQCRQFTQGGGSGGESFQQHQHHHQQRGGRGGGERGRGGRGGNWNQSRQPQQQQQQRPNFSHRHTKNRHERSPINQVYLKDVNAQQQQQRYANKDTVMLMKDRYPTPAAQIPDGKRKLAVLVDAAKVSPVTYANIEPSIAALGTICIRRYFDVSSSLEWQSLEKAIDFQFFRVDTFIPINMQISADAAHIVDFRSVNLISGVCFVVAQSEAGQYETLLDGLKGNETSLYVFDETGARGFIEEQPAK